MPAGPSQPLPKRLARRVAAKVLPTVERAAGRRSTGTPSKSGSPVAAVSAPSKVASTFQNDPETVARAAAVETVIRGGSSAEGWISAAQALLKTKKMQEAVSLGLSLRDRSGQSDEGNLVLGLVQAQHSNPGIAWATLKALPDSLTDLIADVFYRVGFESNPQEATEVLNERLKNQGHTAWKSAYLLRISRDAASTGAEAQATQLLDEIDSRPASTITKAVRAGTDRERSWLPGGSFRKPIKTSDQAINFGLLSYQQPNTVSRNIGDSIQTIAAMGNLVRHSGFTYTGDTELTKFVAEAKSRLKADGVVDSPERSINLIDLYRDGNVYQDLPEPTWAIMYGWYMHATYAGGYNLPFHPNLHPIPISMYFRYPEMLTPEAIDYLREIGPIGCRDWQSVALLTAVGVPAFFSGCITTTVDTLFATEGPDKRDKALFVDSPKTGPGEFRIQEVDDMKEMTNLENLREARRWVTGYADEYAKVTTSRLHSYLPSRSVGSTVTFLPKNPSDNRFGGLIDLTDDGLEVMRTKIREKISAMLQLIAQGQSPHEVRAAWRELVAPDVESARERLTSCGSFHRNLATSHTPSSPEQDQILDVVIDARDAEVKGLKPLVSSLVEHSSRPLRLLVAASKVSGATRKAVTTAAGNHIVEWIDTAAANYSAGHDGLVLTAMDRATGKAVVLPAAAHIHTDVASLVEALGDAPLAAAADPRKNCHSGLTLIRRLASGFKAEHSRALEFTFKATNGLERDFIALDTGVMAFDADALRAAGTLADVDSLAQLKQASLEDAFNVILGPVARVLTPEWNAQPRYISPAEPHITSWRRGAKPWSSVYVSGPAAS